MSLLGGKDPIPYIIVLSMIAVIVLLFAIRRWLLTRKPIETPSVLIGNGQTIGNRVEQDDYFSSAVTPVGTVAVLADGISGLANGRMSSTVAVTTYIREFLKLERPSEIMPYFTRAAQLSNSEIVNNLAGAQGGTTLAAVVIHGGKLYWGAVGDSLIMVFRDRQFIRINAQDTLESVLEEKYLAGEISKEEVESNPMRRRLVNYLGYEQFKNIEVCEEPYRLQKKDKVILCSDGVYNSLTEVELEQILVDAETPHDAAEAMIENIEWKRMKNQDNATVLIVEKGW